MIRATAPLPLALALSAIVGCTRVAPYQRGRLAHPSMTQSNPVGPGEQHMRAVHEGAAGGDLEATSGCGCN